MHAMDNQVVAIIQHRNVFVAAAFAGATYRMQRYTVVQVSFKTHISTWTSYSYKEYSNCTYLSICAGSAEEDVTEGSKLGHDAQVLPYTWVLQSRATYPQPCSAPWRHLFSEHVPTPSFLSSTSARTTTTTLCTTTAYYDCLDTRGYRSLL